VNVALQLEMTKKVLANYCSSVVVDRMVTAMVQLMSVQNQRYDYSINRSSFLGSSVPSVADVAAEVEVEMRVAEMEYATSAVKEQQVP